MASILALHGFTGRGSDFAPFVERVGGHWHCPDLPGHGPDPLLDCSPKATVDFVETQRSTLSSPTPAGFKLSPPRVLLGYSMGARAALQHALAHPEAWDALILISPNPGTEDEIARSERRVVDAKLAQRIEHEGVDAFIEFWQHTPMIRSQQNIRDDWSAAMQTARRMHTRQGLSASLRQFGQGHCPTLWPQLSKLRMPTQLITGEQDRKYTRIATKFLSHPSKHRCDGSRHIETTDQQAVITPNQQKRGPSFRHAIIAEVGHMPHLEAPEATAEVIRLFLKKLSKQR